jgi:hypothetical protein
LVKGRRGGSLLPKSLKINLDQITKLYNMCGAFDKRMPNNKLK